MGSDEDEEALKGSQKYLTPVDTAILKAVFCNSGA